MFTLGIDTSNYTTSVAIYNGEKIVKNCKKLLPVKDGERGLRQSDAVFHHTNQLADVFDEALDGFNEKIDAIAVSSRPRDIEGSYMPCFTVGVNSARILAKALGVPLYMVSHQAGHITAALYSADKLELMDKKFIAFHISGGTTEALLVQQGTEKPFNIEIIAKTLDLNAGQLVDRIGVMLGLHFPCGMELEKLALQYSGSVTAKVALKGADCCLSGIENICMKMLADGADKEKVAFACLMNIQRTLDKMTEVLIEQYGNLPLIYAGGVMSNSIIRKHFEEKYGAFFAEPKFSSDNASGVAILANILHKKEQ